MIVRHSSSTGFWNAIRTVLRGGVTRSHSSQTSPYQASSGLRHQPRQAWIYRNLTARTTRKTAFGPPNIEVVEYSWQRACLVRNGVRDALNLDKVVIRAHAPVCVT